MIPTHLFVVNLTTVDYQLNDKYQNWTNYIVQYPCIEHEQQATTSTSVVIVERLGAGSNQQ
jgi:hypothetical protein